MTPIERRYRRLLRLFPPAYRECHGEELVGTLLDAAGPDRRVPSPGDVVDLARAAGRAWVRAGRRPAAIVAWREGLAAGAAVLLLVQSAYAVVVGSRLAVFGRGASISAAPVDVSDGGHGAVARLAGVALLACWPAAYGLLVARRARAAAGFAAAGTLAAAGWVFVHGLPHDSYLPLSYLAWVGVFALVPAVALRALGRDVRLPGRRGLWSAVLVASAAVGLVVGLVGVRSPTSTGLLAPTVLGVVLVVAAVALAFVVRSRSTLAVAVAMVATPLLGAAAGTAVDRMLYFDEPHPDPALDLGYVLGHWDFGLPLAVGLVAWLVALYGVAVVDP